MATTKNNGIGLGLLLLLLVFKKKKPTINVIVEPEEPTQNLGADYLVQVRDGGLFYDDQKKNVIYWSDGVQKLDGYKTNELPMWVKVKMNGVFYYVKAGDFVIL